MNILFLCTANVQRSKTAQELFQAIDTSNNYKSAGLSRKYVEKAGTTLCTEELLGWADKIYIFEDFHLERIIHYTGKIHLHKITNLKIEDKYQYFQRELVLLLLEKLQIN
ncbi:phosphotyrosine protein phosphatase [Pseudoalteromonas sp. S201]|uniref:phosphotyrosine protein phosphatase n=1 Tax=Pseudoalteromonas sp. S201 TaxID=579519 RepID=UPI00110CDEDD|nr:phosphotyrosine protein phosphatase [Pseudoalteromonas sp. S201]TMS93826.1 phosphotyrosine protein phosphatase [Pseudoalteromonas sp. S201]